MFHVLSVVGARPNFVKIAPIVRALEGTGRFRQTLVHTGQHYEAAMSDAFFEELELPDPDVHLGIGSATHGAQTGRMLEAIEGVLVERRPDAVVVVGDVNSTLAASLAAVKLGVPVAHVEAGLRSGDLTMPEEVNRLVVDRIADLLFTHSPEAEGHLLREGVARERIRFVGNVMIDSLARWIGRARERRGWEAYGLAERGYALVTLHRPSNVDEPERLRRILGLLAGVAERLPVVYPVHPRTRARLAEVGPARSAPGLHLVGPAGYLDFLGLESAARFVLTDSGGVQEETTWLGVPCLTLRPNTERPITIEVGTNRLVDLDALPGAVDDVLAGRTRPGRSPDGWDGRAAERIAGVLVEELESGRLGRRRAG